MPGPYPAIHHTQGLFQHSDQVVLRSVRPGTSRLYGVKWRGFCTWCDAQGHCWQGPSYGNGHHSYLCLWQADIASDPCIQGILRNYRLRRPLVRNNVPPRDLAVVLMYLTGPRFEPLQGPLLLTSPAKPCSCWSWHRKVNFMPQLGVVSLGMSVDPFWLVNLAPF